MSERRLVYHGESDCYMETFSDAEYESCFGDGCSVEVTGYPEHETEFSNRQWEEFARGNQG